MSFAIELAERGLLPDSLIRWGIRQLDKKRLRVEDQGHHENSVRHWHVSLMNSGIVPLPCKYTNPMNNIMKCLRLFLKKF